MISKVILATECFSTNVTGVGTLVGVCAFVDQQVVRLCKMATTESADVLLLRPEHEMKTCFDPKKFQANGIPEYKKQIV